MNIPCFSQTKINSIIFDLDGTLIDSALSIIAGLEISIKKSGLIPAVPLNTMLVGPPLRQTIRKLVGDQTGFDLETLVSDFKNYYDTEGYRMSNPYPGIQELLSTLSRLNISIYLATNKRLTPTLKILDYFGWTSLFKGVYAIDKFKDNPFLNKTAMIRSLINAKSIETTRTIYVGDRIEDFEASSANGLRTVLVNWGYGDFELDPPRDVRYASSSRDLLEMIARAW